MAQQRLLTLVHRGWVGTGERDRTPGRVGEGGDELRGGKRDGEGRGLGGGLAEVPAPREALQTT